MVTAFASGEARNDHFSVRRPRGPTILKSFVALERGQYSLIRTIGISEHEVTFVLNRMVAHKSEAFAVRREGDRTPHVLDQLLCLAAKDRDRVERARKVVFCKAHKIQVAAV